jgi:chromosome segregation ATPase
MSDTAHGGTAAAVDPVERLEQLRRQLDHKKNEIDRLTKSSTDLQADIDGLSKSVDDVEQLLSGYSNAYKDLQKERNELEYFVEQKTKMAAAAIGDKRERIERMSEEYADQIRDTDSHLHHLNGRLSAAEDAVQHATRVAAEKQQAYDHAHDYQATLSSRLTDLKNLKDLVTKADDANDIASMYFLITEAQHVLSSIHLRPQHEVARALYESLAALEEANEELRRKKAERDELHSERDLGEAKLSDLKANRRSHILKLIQGAWPVESA